MENNQLSGRGIFDITDWNEFISLNGLLGQIQLASELETKINQFKYNFLKSKLYTFKQLLEKDDICWLCFNYIDSDSIHYHSNLNSVYDWLGKSIILGTPLVIDGYDLKTLYSDYKKRSWFTFQDWCRVSYKKVMGSKEDPRLLQLFLNQVYYRNRFPRYHIFYKRYGRYGRVNDLKHVYIQEDIDWIRNSFYLIYQNNKNTIDRIKEYSPYSDDINFSNQEKLIDILGGKEFLEEINKKFSPTINKLRLSYRNRLLDKCNYLNDYLFVINRYNQPIPIQCIQDIKNVNIYLEKNKLCFITKPSYYSRTRCFRQYDDLGRNSYLLVFSTRNGELSEIYERVYTNDSWKLTSKLF